MITHGISNFKCTGLIQLFIEVKILKTTELERLKDITLSQRGVATLLKVSHTTIQDLVAKYQKRVLDTNNLVVFKGIDFKIFLEILKSLLLSKKIKENRKEYYIHLLFDFIDSDKLQHILGTLVDDSVQNSFNLLRVRHKENLANTFSDSGSFVYLIKNLTTGNLKIGYSTNPYKRLLTLTR